jgi:tetratricopeptide (TPR) repeat protein
MSRFLQRAFQTLAAPVSWARRAPGQAVCLLILLALIGGGVALAAVGAWGEYHYRTARSELEQHHYAKAEQHIAACLRVRPRSALAHVLAARIDRRQGHFTKALEHLNEAQHLLGIADAIDLERLMLKAEAEDVNPLEHYTLKYLKEHSEEGKIANLEPLKEHPDGLAIVEALSRGYLKQYRYPEAWACIQTWVRWRPSDTEALYCRAWTEMQLQRLDGTETDCTQILQINPEHPHARSLLAACLSAQHRSREALEHFTILRQRGLFPVETALGMARSETELGHTEAAEQLLDEVLAGDPHNAEALRQRGCLALDGGDPAAAERWLRESVQANPYDFSALYAFQQALERCGKPGESREQLAKLVRLRKDMERADDITTNLLGRSPDNADLHCELGVIFLRTGQENSGLESLYRALALDPNHVGAHQALVEYFDRVGRPEDARPHREFLRQRQSPPASPAPGAPAPVSLATGP